MTGVITWVVDCGDGVCIEGKRRPTHFKPMTTFQLSNHFIEPAHRAVNTKRTTVTLSNPSGALAGDVDGDPDFDSLQDVRDHNHGNRANWDVICDVGTSIKQTSVADALTNYRLSGDADHNGLTSDITVDPKTGVINGPLINPIIDPNETYDVAIQSLIIKKLSATGMETGLGEAVGLDSFTVDVVTCPPCGASLGGDFI